ncbi:oligopeptide/dipeptide ABC transporter ATPase [Thermincola ferriacetica]|uniref:Oligopeptide/dipeptide ABC transporter ATPase n=1 Tax=Thermincola ferriacetica TaxID=281456 RepID=A0A0L6W6M5_9FIRM|nr:ABC transporter ATP-binding protein [Thermincola ferriacetica]KNZ71116.1 oligopeptide/dipeptide ABC transporter ATPase [Thermincola ferriacetica]
MAKNVKEGGLIKESQNITPILEVNGLSTSFLTAIGEIKAVRDVSFSLYKGEVLAVVGESGCGKSVTARSVLRLIEPPGYIKSGQVLLNGVNLLNLSENEMRRIRGAEISMVFQDPMTSFDPVYTVGQQFTEALLAHKRISRYEAKQKALHMLSAVSLREPERVFKSYPFQLSGGMRQRVMIAIALAMDPQVLIADEPTTALDVTVQSGILTELRRLNKETGCAIILITHDLGVVAELADRVAVMYAGRIVETGSVYDIFDHAQHPYTRALLASINPAKEDGWLITIPSQPPDMAGLPPGCSFAGRCPEASGLCVHSEPKLYPETSEHRVSCWHTQSEERKIAGA